jgi:hypothetical protein
VVASGLIAARPDDLFGIALSYARFSDGARGLDTDAIRFGTGRLRRDYEAIVEANYQWQIMPGWTLQPNVQYVFHPGRAHRRSRRSDRPNADPQRAGRRPALGLAMVMACPSPSREKGRGGRLILS